MVGGVGAGLTVSVKLVEVHCDPPHTVRVIVAVPLWLAAGVTVTVRLVPLPPSTMLVLGTKVGFEGEPVTVKLVAEAPVWPTVKDKGPQLALALMVWLATAVIVGGGSALTVKEKLVELQSVPAHTVRVMVAVPV
jgi:hypothetical protein